MISPNQNLKFLGSDSEKLINFEVLDPDGESRSNVDIRFPSVADI